MPDFIVENGTGISDSTSYVDVEFADSYLGADWASSVDSKQAALIAATVYADARWGNKLKGVPLGYGQALQMPRKGLLNRYGQSVTGIPTDWKKAICLYAKESAAGKLYPNVQPSAKEVKVKRTQIGPITTEIEYQGSATAATFLKFPLADRLASQFSNMSAGVYR